MDLFKTGRCYDRPGGLVNRDVTPGCSAKNLLKLDQPPPSLLVILSGGIGKNVRFIKEYASPGRYVSSGKLIP
jgi:hypothetical protein